MKTGQLVTVVFAIVAVLAISNAWPAEPQFGTRVLVFSTCRRKNPGGNSRHRPLSSVESRVHRCADDPGRRKERQVEDDSRRRSVTRSCLDVAEFQRGRQQMPFMVWRSIRGSHRTALSTCRIPRMANAGQQLP
jgi:hypothetical protein